jgi:predicted dinucleotide-binding enzyme
MRIGIVGAGRIGGNCARQLVRGGHDVMLSFSREPRRLDSVAADIGNRATVGNPAEATAFGEVIVLSVPWDAIDEAFEQTGSLGGKIVIDTTNQFGNLNLPEEGETAAAHNARRMPGARYTKSFNTLTAAFQSEVAFRGEDERVVQWLCGDNADAKRVVVGLIADAGYVPIDLGGTADCHVMEMPRREGAVYGEEYRLPEALAVVEAVRSGQPIPPTPSYS